MGKKLDALLGRSFKISKLKPTINLAVSRLTVLKNQRGARRSVAQSDVVELLKLGHHEQALLRVEQVIKEQNMLDVFAIIEGYCLLMIERVNLIEQQRVCPEELKEAISSLIYAATRCGELPELQEIRAVITSRFGKEFVARAVELRNNCGVNPKMIKKLSTRQPSLESRLKVLKEIASKSGIPLQIEETSSSSVTTEDKFDAERKQNQPESDPPVNFGGTEVDDNLPSLEKMDSFSDSVKVRIKYRDVADAAQAAFEAAEYAAAAARAAVELSRSESHDPDDHNSSNSRPRKVYHTNESMKSEPQVGEEKDSSGIDDPSVGLGFEKIHPLQIYDSESEEEDMRIGKQAETSEQNENAAVYTRSVSASSSDSPNHNLKGQTKPLVRDIVFDESGDETGNEHIGMSQSRTHDLGFDEVMRSEKSSAFKDEYFPEGSGATKLYYPSHKLFPLGSQAGLKLESGPGNSKSNSAEGSRAAQGAQGVRAEHMPVSVRTKRVHR